MNKQQGTLQLNIAACYFWILSKFFFNGFCIITCDYEPAIWFYYLMKYLKNVHVLRQINLSISLSTIISPIDMSQDFNFFSTMNSQHFAYLMSIEKKTIVLIVLMHIEKRFSFFLISFPRKWNVYKCFCSYRYWVREFISPNDCANVSYSSIKIEIYISNWQ